MQTHKDSDFDWDRLKERAEEATGSSASGITAGYPDEPIVDQWKARRMHFFRRPDDEQGIFRVSLGGGVVDIDYCVFRGEPGQCVALLRRAAQAIEEHQGNRPSNIEPSNLGPS